MMDQQMLETNRAPPAYVDAINESRAVSSSANRILSSESDEERPPAFSASPVTLVLLPNSTLITPTRAHTRALYELTQPLDGHSLTVSLVEILPESPLRPDGRLNNFQERYTLYKVCEHKEYPRRPNTTAISDLRAPSDQCVVLEKRWGIVRSWEARSYNGRFSGEGKIAFTAKSVKGCIKWKDASGNLVATEKPAENWRTDPESIVILIPLHKKILDLLVAIWVARIYQETRKEGLKEEAEDSKNRRADQKVQNAAERKPSGILHNMKEILGIGRGVKNGPRSGNMFTGPPTVNSDGTIKWS